MFAEFISKLRALLSSPTSPKTLISHEEFCVWRDQYFSLHKNHQVEAGARLGRAFCQEYKIHDREIEEATQRITAETLIYARYVSRHRE